jgi:hypothetical protein
MSARRRKELQMIATACKLLDDERTPQAIADFYAAVQKQYPDVLFAQAGAEWDARSLLADVGKTFSHQRGPRLDKPSKKALALVMAGVLRCTLGHRCGHAVPFAPIPLVAFLGPRVLACKSCLAQFGATMIAYDREIANNTECDLCLERGVKQFFRFAVSLGAAVILGDVCRPCAVLMGNPAASQTS